MGKFRETTLQLWPLIDVQNCIFVKIYGWGRGGPLLFTTFRLSDHSINNNVSTVLFIFQSVP